MPNPFGVPEISALDADCRRQQNDAILLDVREVEEYAVRVAGDDVIYVPLSEIAANRLAAIPDSLADKGQEIIVLCHHGIRSAQVAAWMAQEGWTNVINMDGGIEAWATTVDGTIGRY